VQVDGSIPPSLCGMNPVCARSERRGQIYATSEQETARPGTGNPRPHRRVLGPAWCVGA